MRARHLHADRRAAAAPPAAPVETRLQFAVDAAGRTYLARQYAAYPHHLTRTFYLDRSAPHAATVYLQSLSGGLMQDDRVVVRVSTAERAVAHVTTQAATKVHGMEHGCAVQQVELEAAADSHLEFIADPAICFPRSRLEMRTELRIAPAASAILSESYLWHDPRGMADMAFDALTIETAIRRPDGRLLALDRSRLAAASGLLGNPAVFGPCRALGTLFAVGRGAGDEATVAALRASLASCSPQAYAGVSRLPSGVGLWMRVLASDGATLRAVLERAWQACHRAMLGWPCERRRK